MVSELSVPRPVGSLATVHKNATMALEDRSPLFSDLKKLIVEAFGTPRWISELSAMANEVRKRTMLVVVHSHIQPINDIAIYHAISEIGLIEDVRYLPVVSGFHSRLRFCSKTDVDWVYHYYNGMYLPEGCCKLEILRANEVISWNLQKLAEIKERYKIDDSSKVTSEDHLSGMKLKSDEAVIEMKESTQLEVKDKSKSAQEPFGWVAHQVLDEMLKPQTDLKASKVSDLSDARPLSVVYKEFTDLTKGLDELPVQDDVSFDPGGKSNVVLKDNSDVLDDGDALTVKGLIFDGVLTMGEESVQMEITEKLEVEKGTLQLDVHYMFHEMSEWKISSEIKLGMPLLSRASSFVVVMNPPHHVAQGSGSTELIFTLQKWLLMGAWVDANPDDEMLPFDPGGTRLTPLAYKIDHKAMLVSPTEEQDNFKPFNASELIQNIMYKLFADKLDCMKEGAFDPGGEERDMTDVLTMTLLVIDGSTNGQLSKAVLKIDEIVKGDGEMVPMELTNELIQMGELLDSNGYQLLDTFSKSASINKHEPTEKEEVQLEKHVRGTNTSLLMEFDKCIGSWVAKDDGIEMPIFDPGGEPMFTNGNSLHLNFILQRKISLWSAEKNNVQKFKEQKCSEVLNVDISMLVFYPELSLTAVGVSDMLELKSFEEAFKMKGFFLTTPDRFSNFKKWKFAAEFTTEVRQVINRYVDFHMMSKTEFLSLAELQRLLSFVYGGVQAESSDVLLISNSGLWNLFDYDGHIWNGPVESKLQSESFSCLGSNLQEGSLRSTSLVSIYGENGRLSLFFKCSYCDFQLLVFDPCIALMEERKSGTKMALIFCRTNVCKFFFELSFMDKGLNDNLQLQSEEAKKNLHHSFPICVDMRDERHFLFNSGIVEGILGALTTTNSLNYDAANANIKSFEKCNHFPMTAGFLTDSEFQQLKLTRDEYLMQIIHSIHVHELGVDTCMVEISLIRCKSWTDVNGDDVNMLSEIPLLRVKPLIDTKESMVIEDFTLGCKRFLFRDHADFLSNEDCYAY